MLQLGLHALISLVIYLLAIGASFQLIKDLPLEKLLSRIKPLQAQFLLIFVAIALGYLVGQFLITLIDTSLQLSNLF